MRIRVLLSVRGSNFEAVAESVSAELQAYKVDLICLADCDRPDRHTEWIPLFVPCTPVNSMVVASA
jgi:hypothetical protein